MKELLKKNIPFIVLLAVILLCAAMGKTSFSMSVVSNPDSQIVFSTGQTVLEQTWQPPVKNIAGLRVPYTSMADFDGDMTFLIYTDDRAEVLAQTSMHCVFRAGEEGVLEPDLPKIRVIPGERYRICLRYQDVSAEGTLLLGAGSQYGGCSIDGADCNAAAAFDVISEKPSLWLQILAVFGPFTAFSLLFMTLWGRKWEDCIGLSMFGIVAFLYVAGLSGHLLAGMVLVYVLAGLSLAASIYLYNKKKIPAGDLYSPAMIVYALLCVLIVFNCKGAWFARWDEYSHWGLAVKDMFFYDSFAKHMNTTVTMPRYVPFATLIEYFFVFANGMFTQEMVYIAYQIAMLNALIALCRIARKRKIYLISALTVMIFLPIIFFADIYNSIYVDPMMAVFTAYVLICYYTEEMKGFNLLRILGGLFALTLTKDMGMVIAGLLAAVMVADRLYQSLRQKKKVIRSLLCPCACALFVICLYMSWQIYMSIPVKVPAADTAGIEATLAEEAGDIPLLAGVYEETASLDERFAGEPEQTVSFQSTVSASGITLDGLLGLLRHEDGGYRYQAIKNYLITMFDGESYRFGNIGVSYIDMYILLLLLIGGLWLAGFWGPWIDKMVSFGIFTFLAGICYSLVLELFYLFTFSMGDALQLVSHERYLGSFLGGVVIAFAGLLMSRADEAGQENKRLSSAVMAVLTAGIVICTPVQNFFVKNMDTQMTAEHVSGSEEIMEAFRSISKRGENVYCVCNGSIGYSRYLVKNLISPVLVPYPGYDIYDSEAAYARQREIWNERGEEAPETGWIVPCDVWENELQDAQYVFLFHPGDVFQESYGRLFEESDTIEDGAYYRVERTAEGIRLRFMGKIDVGSYK